MLNISGITYHIGGRTLLDNASVVLGPKEKVVLVGRNGAGKSTLFKLIQGQLTPDEGTIQFPNEVTIGTLSQDLNMDTSRTVMEEAMSGLADVKAMQAELDNIEKELEHRTDYESNAYARIIDRITFLSEKLHDAGGAKMMAQAERILKGLGFDRDRFEDKVSTLSGGWQIRVLLAKLLLQAPDILLLDEPTNHLDMPSIIWLEQFLMDYPGLVIVISHDKSFLNNVSSRTIEIANQKIYDYPYAYIKAMTFRNERMSMLETAYNNQQKLIAQKEATINRFKAKATKTSMAQSMQKSLDKMERITIDTRDGSKLSIRFRPFRRIGEKAFSARNIYKSYDELKVLQGTNLIVERGEKVALVGQNGTGKSTFSKIIAGVDKNYSGDVEIGYNVNLGYYAQNQAEVLDPNLTLLETLEKVSPEEMRTQLRGILGAMMFSGEDVDKKVSVLSGGERARLAFAQLLLEPHNVLLLDEPTNHLDVEAKDLLKAAMANYEGTLIVVSHDRDFLDGLVDRTIEFRHGEIKEYLGGLEYFLDKSGLNNMRDLDVSPSSLASKSTKTTPTQSNEERRATEKKVQSIERKIENLESKINKAQLEMADPAFYQQENHQKKIDKMKQWQDELRTFESEWETLLELLEN